MAKDEDCESIVELAAYLSEYYRYITKDAKSNKKLEEEVQHARKYAKIQAMRFRHRLSVEFDEMPAEYRDIIVPRLILQPLLENAFEHGLRDVEKDGVIKVWYENKENKLYVHVQDNGGGMSEETQNELNEGFKQRSELIENGLCNINRRLNIHFGEGYGVEIKTVKNQGTICSLILPINDREGWKCTES